MIVLNCELSISNIAQCQFKLTLHKKWRFPVDKYFFSKCEQVFHKLWIFLYFLKKISLDNFIFCVALKVIFFLAVF